MTAELEGLQAAAALINAAGVPIVALIALFGLYRFERQNVRDLEVKRIEDQIRHTETVKAMNQQRIDDYKGWMQVLAGMPPISRTPTNLGV